MRLIIFALLVNFVRSQMLKNPGEFAHIFNEEEFEDYLDKWLEKNEIKWNPAKRNKPPAGCSFSINGDLGNPQPVYLRENAYLAPNGNSGQIYLSPEEDVYVSCPGSKQIIKHPNVTDSTASGVATCAQDALVYGWGWLEGNKNEFANISCSSHPTHQALATNETCFNNNLVIKVGFTVDETFYTLFRSCFDESRLEALYSWYGQDETNAVHQANVERPGWQACGFYPGVDINGKYSKKQQKDAIAQYVGQDMAVQYIAGNQYLSRGHLAAKTDFVFASGQRATFYFSNAAPQWQPFNAGNWNWVEQNARTRIGEAGYNAVVYTGTYGVTQLRDQNNTLVDIYLHQDLNNNPQVPVPMYFYKVIYDSSKYLGTAFIGINNPYYTEDEVVQLQFCKDQCRNNPDFSWLRWQPDRIDIGYSFCCSVDDFRRFVPHLPNFRVDGLLV